LLTSEKLTNWPSAIQRKETSGHSALASHALAPIVRPHRRLSRARLSAFPVLVVVGSIWQPDRLEKGRATAHIYGMPKLQRIRLLEVRIVPIKPNDWEWQVCEGETAIASGHETTRETAQLEGNSALFSFLAAGI
jgi:hypothetical protein